MKKSEKKTSEAFKRKVLARLRLLSVRGVAVERAAVDIGVEAADLATWIREAASDSPLFVPVHVEDEAVVDTLQLHARHLALELEFFQKRNAWVLEYGVGQFAPLHTDRPDSDLTGLLALDREREPLVLCPELAGLDDQDLARISARTPHPPGVIVCLEADRLLMIEGARVPHHRPPVGRHCEVLSLSLAAS